MAYTVKHLYDKVIEGSDKMGSDFFDVPYVMNRLVTATYDFIGETVKYVENTQEIRDDLLALYKPFKIPVIVDPDDNEFVAVALPNDYLHLMSAKVIDANVKVRETNLIRHGQNEIQEIDPDTKATAEYPIIYLYNTLMRIVSPGTPTYVQGFYVKKPTFGAFSEQDDIETEIAVNLPDNSTEQIIKTIINDIFVATGDPRAQVQYINKETFRNRKKDL